MGNTPSLIADPRVIPATQEIPETQKAFYVLEKNTDLQEVKVEVKTDVAVPKPKSGEVLIRVVAAPVNPSDFGVWTRPSASGKDDVPMVAGTEGSGIVIASGGGFVANRMVGKNVGFVKPKNGGSYQQYVIVDAMTGVFPLSEGVKCEDAASHFVNPYTVCGFIDTLRKRHTGPLENIGLVHTAAASQLGQMLVKLAKEENITLINVVRREDQATVLKDIGAAYIINSSEDGWETSLRTMMKDLKINVIFDAISGDMSGTLLNLLPNGGTLFAYGKLSGSTCNGIQFTDLSYKNKKFEGFLLTNWLLEHGQGLLTMQRINAATKKVHRGLSKPDGWSSSKYQDCNIDNMFEMLLENMKSTSSVTGRKLRIRFDQEN